MTEEEKIFAGKLFNPLSEELKKIKRVSHNLCHQYNDTYEEETEIRNQIIQKLLKKVGKGVFFQGPIFFNYGTHTSIGDGFFGNYHFTVLDDAEVTIENRVLCGPNTTIVTPFHPLLVKERREMTTKEGETIRPCYAKPVVIEDDVWLGANVTVCGGVTIGKGSVIGAGSVVSRDIPAGVVAVGNPCRVLRSITEKDSVAHLLAEEF